MSVLDTKFGAIPNPSKKKAKNFMFFVNAQPKHVEMRADCEATMNDWLASFQVRSVHGVDVCVSLWMCVMCG